MTEAGARDAVSVVVPFAGETHEACALLSALEHLAFGPDDEAIVVDNSATGVVTSLDHRAPIRSVPAPEQASSYYARNVGSEQARNEWLLFIDSDCLPTPSLIDDYFSDAIADDVGAVAGAVLPADSSNGLVERYKSFRRHLDQDKSSQAARPWAATANLLVRRAAWAELGGFSERIRSGGDIDFSWRLFASGWRLSYQPRAAIRHLHRDSLKAHAAQQIRYGGAHTWLQRRYPGTKMSRPLAKQLPLSAAGAVRRAAVGDWEWSAFHLLDGVTAVMLSVGKLRGNAVATSQGQTPVAILADRWPDASDDEARHVIAKAVETSHTIHIEARHRPIRIARDAARDVPSNYMEDDSPLETLESIAWLMVRKPRQTVRALLERGDDRASLRTLARLAPAARRIARSGGHDLRAADTVSAVDASELADLIGATYNAAGRSAVPAQGAADSSV
jgi:GT2 family glycosyltransferase